MKPLRRCESHQSLAPEIIPCKSKPVTERGEKGTIEENQLATDNKKKQRPYSPKPLLRKKREAISRPDTEETWCADWKAWLPIRTMKLLLELNGEPNDGSLSWTRKGQTNKEELALLLLTTWEKNPLRRTSHRRKWGELAKKGSDPNRERKILSPQQYHCSRIHIFAPPEGQGERDSLLPEEARDTTQTS